eukprot:maker-scaffold112_size353035-snap-gene-2.42 protein:Tk07407 transcript:maker-scaffold112_size353035-snap-gene-2.42-mRNA-1 annotation:"phosphatidylserine decarboxylase proenzyme"
MSPVPHLAQSIRPEETQSLQEDELNNTLVSMSLCDCDDHQDSSDHSSSTDMWQQRQKSHLRSTVDVKKSSYTSYLRFPLDSSKYYKDESVKFWKQIKGSNAYYTWGANRASRVREQPFSKWLGPLCLPMLLVIQPLSDANFRIILALLVLAFIAWIQNNRGYYRIFGKRVWLQGQERHCEKCDVSLLDQIKAEAKPVVSWHVRSLRRMPWRILSRNVGNLINATTLFPLWVTWVVIWFYIRLFGCRLHEADRDAIRDYISLGDFFCRKLKEGLRPISSNSSIVSPADGTVTFSGRFNTGYLEQVKGVHYSLGYFLGLENHEGEHGSLHACSNEDSLSRLLHARDGSTALFQWVIYLSPGDYHRFHSPTDWNIKKRRHFPGELLSVKPNMVAAFPGLFHVNERVAWLGDWEHGFFSMTAVGATNVGSIHADFDPELRTNQAVTLRRECTMATACSRRTFHFNEKVYDSSIAMGKGDEFGHFKFGSTLVLLFEAPKDFQWIRDIQSGEDSSFFNVQALRHFGHGSSGTCFEFLEVKVWIK